MLKQAAAAVMLVGLGVAAGMAFSGSDPDQTPPPPESSDTVGVTPAELAEIQRAWWSEIPEEATSDRRNQADTVYQTDTRVVQRPAGACLTGPESVELEVEPLALEGRWYLDTLQAPRAPGDSGLYAVTYLEGDTTGRVTRQDALMRHPSPPGPLRSVAMDAQGLHVEYADRWPGTDQSPSLLAEKLPMTAGCVALGLYAGDAEAGLACEAGSWGQVGVGRLIRAVF